MKEIILLIYLTVLSIFDLQEKKVPLFLVGAGIFAAVCYEVYVFMSETAHPEWVVAFACLGMIPGVFLLGVARLTGKAGYGDGLALLNVGMVMGYRYSLLLLCCSLMLAAVVSIVMLAVHKADRDTMLPYLPLLTATYIAGMFV